MAQCEIDTKRLAQQITLYVNLRRMTEWKWRLGLGMWLMRLAARIMWVSIEFEGQL